MRIEKKVFERLHKDINQSIEYNTTTKEHEISEYALRVILCNYFNLDEVSK
jgi:hypothetical protein